MSVIPKESHPLAFPYILCFSFSHRISVPDVQILRQYTHTQKKFQLICILIKVIFLNCFSETKYYIPVSLDIYGEKL